MTRKDKKNPSPLDAIREFCVENCMGGSSQEVESCQSSDTCSLHAFRFGKNPYLKGRMSESQKEAKRKLIVALNKGNKARQVVEESSPRNAKLNPSGPVIPIDHQKPVQGRKGDQS